ncbi:cytochrome P450 [Lipomyces kononenkoae]|uniref:Cytochrome P450 n=1 Tax=Lipomyces kononenkoae TaxID=34357 RepID=A0ACC3T4R7_LIPKO
MAVLTLHQQHFSAVEFMNKPVLVLLTTLALFLIYVLVRCVSDIKVEQEFAKKGAVRLPSRSEDFLGLRLFWTLFRALQKDKYLDVARRYHDEHGATFATRLLGEMIINTIDPENIKAVLATQFNDFDLGNRYEAFYPLLGDGIFTLDHEAWSRSRGLLRPQFSRQQVSDVAKLEPYLQDLIARLDRAPAESCDIQELFYKLTIDSATEFLFGQSVNSLRLTGPSPAADNIPDVKRASQSEIAAVFARAFDYCQEIVAFRCLLQSWYWLMNPKKFRDNITIVHRFVDHYVDRAVSLVRQSIETKKQGEVVQSERYMFLEALAEETQDPKALRDQSLNILLAGRDTTAGLLSWTFYLLARHPRVLEKLRTEIIDTFGNRLHSPGKKQINFETLKNATYLRHVLNEVLRLYPSVPSNFRVANKDTTLPRGGGADGSSPVLVRKGEKVFFTVFFMHRRKDLFGEDADDFRPERWEANRWMWEYLPFNGGPRICLGQQYALTEAAYTVVRLLQQFDTLENKDLPEENGIPLKRSWLTMSNAKGVHVRLYNK